MRDVLTLLAAMAMLIPLGCEKSGEAPDEPIIFDKDLDGPPTYLYVPPDEDLLKDQARIAREAAAASGSTAAPPVDPIEAVKEAMAALIAANQAGNTDQIANAFEPAGAAALRKFFSDTKKVQARLKPFQQLIRTKLGMDPPEAMKKKGLGEEDLSGLFGPKLSEVKVEDLKITQTGQTVVVTRPKAPKLTFVKVGRRWKIRLNPTAKQLLELLSQVASAAEKVIDELTAGINNGSITKADFEAKTDEITEKHMAPLLGKMMALMMKLMSETTGPAAPAPPPSPPEDISF